MPESRYTIVEYEECQTCAYYRQHYILTNHCRPMPLHYGHCVQSPHRKRRTPDDGCKHWKQIET